MIRMKSGGKLGQSSVIGFDREQPLHRQIPMF